MARTNFQTIDEYIDTFPGNVRILLGRIRKTIRKVAPKAEEAISYQMPAFKLNGRILVYFAAWKRHVAMYPVPMGDTQFKKELARYSTGKGRVQFPLDKPLPVRFIRKTVLYTVGENLERLNRGKK